MCTNNLTSSGFDIPIQDLLENEDFKLEEIFVLSLVRDVATVMYWPVKINCLEQAANLKG